MSTEAPRSAETNYVRRPRLLDLFSCEGGAAMGYHQAGFDVVGVDTVDRSKRYPFEFHQGDALEYIEEHAHAFDAVHASPPCKAFTRTGWAFKYGFHANRAGEAKEWADAMDIDWMSAEGLSQAIPPAYTRYLGALLLEEVRVTTPPGTTGGGPGA